MKSGNLNFLEPSGPLEACNGTDLPSTFYNGGVETVTSACDLTTDWIYMSVYMNRASASRRWGTVEWLWRHDQRLLPRYTRVAYYMSNYLVMYLHVRSAFTSSYVRVVRRGWRLSTCLSTKPCQSAGNVVVRRHSFYILALDSSFCSFTIGIYLYVSGVTTWMSSGSRTFASTFSNIHALTKQNKTKQNKTKQNKTKQNKTKNKKQNKKETKQKTEKTKPKQNKTKQNKNKKTKKQKRKNKTKQKPKQNKIK